MNLESDNHQQQRDIYTISRLNQEVSLLLNNNFPLIWLEGEISNFTQASSGHMYLSLKDAKSQVRSAMFRNRNQYLNFKPSNGTQVLVRGRIGLYEPRGDFQLIIEHMEEAGDGALRRAFEALKAQLNEEGLFDPADKQSIPDFPKQIGIITSPTGAAIRDTLSVLKRRFPMLPILIYPVLVQGSGAAEDVAQTLALACKRKDCDVLLLVRGGGSLEDLQAFNTESVARAIAAADIPVISGIGHEIDFTIADFVADLRAATPSAAAELVSPNQTEWLANLQQTSKQLLYVLKRQLDNKQESFKVLEKQLQRLHPARQLEDQIQRVDELETRLNYAWVNRVKHAENHISNISIRLQHHSPQIQLNKLNTHYQYLYTRLNNGIQQQLKQTDYRLKTTLHNLNTISPLATLDRGYAIVSNTSNNQAVRDIQETTIGDKLDVRLAKGRLSVTVNKTL